MTSPARRCRIRLRLTLSLMIAVGLACDRGPSATSGYGGNGGRTNSAGGNGGLAPAGGNGGLTAAGGNGGVSVGGGGGGGQVGGAGGPAGGVGGGGPAGKGGSAGGDVGGVAGAGGAGGKGGAGGGADVSCHTNADCPSGVCFIAAPITDCVTAPAGRCTPGGNMGNCALAAYHGYCGCLRDLDLSVCAAFAGHGCNGLVGSTFPSDGSWSDYSTPTSCFGCFPVAPSTAVPPAMSVYPGVATGSF